MTFSGFWYRTMDDTLIYKNYFSISVIMKVAAVATTSTTKIKSNQFLTTQNTL